MTEVVTAPQKREEQELSRINHWIGGRVVPGTSGRVGPVFNPATGAVANPLQAGTGNGTLPNRILAFGLRFEY